MQKTDKIDRRIYYGTFRSFEEGLLLGKAHLNLLTRKRLQLNVNVEMYSQGYYPFFREKHAESKITIILPLPVILDLADEIRAKGIRVQKTSNHKWIKRRFKSTHVVKTATNSK